MDTLSDKLARVNINVGQYTKKRLRNRRIAKLFELSGEEKKAKLVGECGSFLEWTMRADGTKYLSGANFCRLRMCPMCAWNLARQRARDLLRVLQEPEHRGKRYLFITLTVRNCTAGDLGDTLDMMYAGLRSLTNKNHYLQRRMLGIIKKLEITYNKNTKEFHPHFHLLCEVEPEYFSKGSKDYITHDSLMAKWREACGLDYDPSVNIKPVRRKDIGRDGSIEEVTKYTAKDSHYGYSLETFKVFCNVLHRRRLYTPTGSFKETMARLKIDPDSFVGAKKEAAVPDNPEILRFVLRWTCREYKIEVTKIKDGENSRLAGCALIGEFNSG